MKDDPLNVINIDVHASLMPSKKVQGAVVAWLKARRRNSTFKYAFILALTVEQW